MYQSAKLAASDAEEFNKKNLKLSDLFNYYGNPSFPIIEIGEFYLLMNKR